MVEKKQCKKRFENACKKRTKDFKWGDDKNGKGKGRKHSGWIVCVWIKKINISA